MTQTPEEHRRPSIIAVERQRDDLKFWLVSAVTTLISIAVLYAMVYHWKTDDPLLKEVREAIATAAATTAFFGVFYSWVSRFDHNAAIERGLSTVLGDRPDIFAKFSPEVRKSFVRNSLLATLGNNVGTAAWDNVIDPLTNLKSAYRYNYRYDIQAYDYHPALSQAGPQAPNALRAHLRSNSTKFIWLRETIQYQAVNPVEKSIHKGPYKICLATDKQTLQSLFSDNEIFFREIIELDETCLGYLAAMNDEELQDFVVGVLDFRVTEYRTGKEVSFKVLGTSSMAIGRLITITVDSIDAIPGGEGLKLSFVTPQFRDAPWFVVSLPQPTDSPTISFRKSECMSRLEPVTFLPKVGGDRVRTELLSGLSGDYLGVELKVEGWTFPTSGVMFTWRYKTNLLQSGLPKDGTSPT